MLSVNAHSTDPPLHLAGNTSGGWHCCAIGPSDNADGQSPRLTPQGST